MDKDYRSGREVSLNEVRKPQQNIPVATDAGAGWAVALVVLILSIGFAFVVFSNNEAIKDMRIGQSLDQLKQSLDAKSPSADQASVPLTPVKGNGDLGSASGNGPKSPDESSM